MQRRTLLRRLTTGLAATGVASGLGSAERDLYIKWERPDGQTELIEPAAFDERSDTPPLSSIDSAALASPVCCDCVGGTNPCVGCGGDSGCGGLLKL